MPTRRRARSMVARNVANADTPGYRARDLAASPTSTAADPTWTCGAPAPATLTRRHVGPAARIVDAGGEASPNGNTVSLETEMIRSAEVKRDHDLALAVYRTSLDILRVVPWPRPLIGRRRGRMPELSDTLSFSASGMQAQARPAAPCCPRTSPTPTRRATAARSSASKRCVEARTGRTGRCRPGRSRSTGATCRGSSTPRIPMADETGHYDGSNVDLVVEIADAREAQRSYEANLRMFDQARQMSRGLLDLLRR